MCLLFYGKKTKWTFWPTKYFSFVSFLFLLPGISFFFHLNYDKNIIGDIMSVTFSLQDEGCSVLA